MVDKVWDQPKLSPTPKFIVDDKARDSQQKFIPTPRFLVADKAQDTQTKLSPTPKFPLADKAFVRDSQPNLSILHYFVH